MVVAASRSPFASLRAALHSIIPAPVRSRSFFTNAALISIVAILAPSMEGPLASGPTPYRQTPAQENPRRRKETLLNGRGGLFGARTHRPRAAGAIHVGVRTFIGLRRLPDAAAGGDGIRDLRGEQPDRAQRIVVARDHVVHFVGIAVGVDDADDRDLQF